MGLLFVVLILRLVIRVEIWYFVICRVCVLGIWYFGLVLICVGQGEISWSLVFVGFYSLRLSFWNCQLLLDLFCLVMSWISVLCALGVGLMLIMLVW